MKNRVEEVVVAIVEGVRSALKRHQVTFDEYRTGVKYLMQVAETGETPLLLDVFFNTTICEIENGSHDGTHGTIEGPYYLNDAPFVEKSLRTYDDDRGCPLLLKGRVTDTTGGPIAHAVVDIWHSTPDGLYGGFHGDIPSDYYRGKIKTDGDGHYEVITTTPVPYQIPNSGPTGALLDKMGRHSWRPAHVHYKIYAEGYQTLTTQAYFEGDPYVSSDCCEGVLSGLVHKDKLENGIKLIENNFMLAPAVVRAWTA